MKRMLVLVLLTAVLVPCATAFGGQGVVRLEPGADGGPVIRYKYQAPSKDPKDVDLVVADALKDFLKSEKDAGRPVGDTKVEPIAWENVPSVAEGDLQSEEGAMPDAEEKAGFAYRLRFTPKGFPVEQNRVIVVHPPRRAGGQGDLSIHPFAEPSQRQFADSIPQAVDRGLIDRKVNALRNEFMALYRVYTKLALSQGRNSPEAQVAAARYQKAYNTYKGFVDGSATLKKIAAGELKVSRVVIRKADFTSTVYVGDEIVRIFPIAYGSNPDGSDKKAVGDCRTPEGNFKVIYKAVNPPYQGIPGGAPNNPLGTRWMGLSSHWDGIGMHGTSAPSSIGSRASHGCVRMFTKDAEVLYGLVSVGTPVSLLGVSAGGVALPNVGNPTPGAPPSGAPRTGWIREDMGERNGDRFVITRDDVNVRSGPGTENGVLDTVARGTAFPITGEKDGWVQVSLP